jgi:pimeloyl-ACP methyl ester carboxylesterase
MSSVTSDDGTAIAYDRSGDGPPVILVGGALQYRAADPPTAQLAALLSEQCTVFHYDRRGRGESGDTAPYEVKREIEDLAALIAEAGGSASLFGNSSGAVLALDATAAGLDVPKVAIYEVPFIVDSSRAPAPDDYQAQLEDLLVAGKRSEAVELLMTAVVGVPAEFVGGMKGQPFWPALEAVAHTLPYDAKLMAGTQAGRPLPTERWANVKVPTLVIDGGASEPWIGHGARALADLLADAERRTLEGQTHAVEAAVLAPVLLDFFVG